MKKNLLLIASILPFTAAFGQLGGYVGSGANVVVKENTLFYVSGDLELAANSAQVVNDGKINVRSDFTNNGSGSNFVNTYSSATQYGQLIIDAADNVNGKVVMQKQLIATGDTSFNGSWLPYTFPFQEYSFSTAASQMGYNPLVADGSRYSNTFMLWNNNPSSMQEIAFDHGSNAGISAVSYLKPYLFYIENNYNANPANAGLVQNYLGKPFNAAVTTPTNTYQVGGRLAENRYGEDFETFIDDAFRSNGTSDWSDSGNLDGYGNNIFQFANPYTSNIDLSYINLNETNGDNVDLNNLVGFATAASSDYDSDLGTTNQVEGVVATFDSNGQLAAGDRTAGIIRPFQGFYIKGTQTIGNMQFTEGMKTFDDVSRASTDINGDGTTGRNLSNDYYQLGMFVAVNDQPISNRFYVVASDNYEAAASGASEAYNRNLGNANGMFTLQENEDGSINQDLSTDRTLINGINKSNYIAKPIHVGIQSNGENTFTIKTELSKNMALVDGLSFDDNNVFYLEDRETGFIAPITNGFEYTFTQNEDTTDRIFIYWNGTPDNLAVEDATELAGETIIYKNQGNHEIRFDKTWNTADVFVYNTLGQLVFSQKAVDANQVFVLPFSKDQSLAYIVKTISDKGEVVTKKIVR